MVKGFSGVELTDWLFAYLLTTWDIGLRFSIDFGFQCGTVRCGLACGVDYEGTICLFAYDLAWLGFFALCR